MKRVTIFIIVIISIVLILVEFSQFFYPQKSQADEPAISVPRRPIIEGNLPVVKVKATVVSLRLGDINLSAKNLRRRLWDLGFTDEGVLRIDDINRTWDPRNTINLSVGEEVYAIFRYSARPAKLITTKLTNKTNTIKDGFIIYYFVANLVGNRDKEITLPGIHENDQIEFWVESGNIEILKLSGAYSHEKRIRVGEYSIVDKA